MFMKKRLTVLIGLLAALAVLSGCYKNDPLKEKERALESGRTKTEQPTGTEDGSGSKPADNLNGGEGGSGDAGGNNGGAEGGKDGSGSGEGDNSGGEGAGDKKPEDQPKPDPNIKTVYSFDLWATVPKKKHTIPLLTADEDPAASFWVSASNYGYDFSGNSKVKGYPVEVAPKGYKGQAVRLRTVDTFFALVTGALYSGKVNERKITNPTLFGQPCPYEPLELSFYYHYTPGQSKVAGLPGDRDHASVQGVLYEITTNDAYLDSKSVKNDTRIVSRAYALLPETKAGQWTEQTIKFEPIKELAGSIDFKTKKYRLSIIISSSAKGDEFKGAHLSELHLDELTLTSRKH